MSTTVKQTPGSQRTTDHCHRVIRRLGFAPFPLGCIVITTLLPIVQRHLALAGASVDRGLCFLLFVCLGLLKILLGLVLLGIACRQRASTLLSEDAKKADDEMFKEARFPMQKEHNAKFSDKKVIPLEAVDR